MDSLASIPGWKILVVDPEALQVLDSACKMSEILSQNVTGRSLSLFANALSLFQTLSNPPPLQWSRVWRNGGNPIQTRTLVIS
jgi:hypothetical protein